MSSVRLYFLRQGITMAEAHLIKTVVAVTMLKVIATAMTTATALASLI